MIGLLDTFGPGIVILYFHMSRNDIGDNNLPLFVRIAENILVFRGLNIGFEFLAKEF